MPRFRAASRPTAPAVGARLIALRGAGLRFKPEGGCTNTSARSPCVSTHAPPPVGTVPEDQGRELQEEGGAKGRWFRAFGNYKKRLLVQMKVRYGCINAFYNGLNSR